jgi:uncharacterized protein (DUF58 family)
MELTTTGRVVMGGTVALFLQGYLMGNVLPVTLGIALLAYVINARSYVHQAVKAGAPEVERSLEETTYFAQSPVTIQVSFRKATSRPLPVTITDHVPEDTFVLEGSNVHTATLGLDGELDYSYAMVRKRRGTARFSHIDVTYGDPRRLFRHTERITAPTEVTFLDSKEQIKRAEGAAHKTGREEVTSSYVGTSSGFASATVRDYMPGDRMTDINWKASSRLRRLLTKLSESEEFGHIYVMLDASGSMRRTAGTYSKFDHAMLISMQLAKIFTDHENPTGFIAFDEYAVQAHVAPAVRRTTYGDILDAMKRLPDSYRAPGAKVPSYDEARTDPSSRAYVSRIMPFLNRSRRRITASLASPAVTKAMDEVVGRSSSAGLCVLVSDLETHTRTAVSALKEARTHGIHMVLITPYSPWYEMRLSDLTIDEAEELYSTYREKQRGLRTLRSVDVIVIEETPNDSVENVYAHIKEGLR